MFSVSCPGTRRRLDSVVRKWGLYLIALGGLGSLAVDFVSGLPLGVEDLLPLLGLLILVGILRPNGRWQLFHF